MPRKRGRPRVAKKDAFSKYFSVRLRPDEAKEVQDAIRKSGQSRPAWLRSALVKVARNG
jgi:hypothetical protein